MKVSKHCYIYPNEVIHIGSGYINDDYKIIITMKNGSKILASHPIKHKNILSELRLKLTSIYSDCYVIPSEVIHVGIKIGKAEFDNSIIVTMKNGSEIVVCDIDNYDLNSDLPASIIESIVSKIN